MVQEIADSLHEEIAAQARKEGQELPAEEIIAHAEPETPKKSAGTAKWQLLLAFLLGALCMALAGDIDAALYASDERRPGADDRSIHLV